MRTANKILSVVAVLCASVVMYQRTSSGTPAAKEPRIRVEFEASRPPYGISRSSGVRLVVWGDGSVLYGVDPMNPAKDMRVGQLSESQLEAAWRAVHESGLTTHSDTAYMVPDASSVGVVIQVEGKTHTHWLSDYRWAGLDWWPKAEEALAKFRPAESKPVEEVAINGMYRGYDVKEWWRTAWRR